MNELIRNISFNQDGTCIYMVTDTGYTIYSIINSYTQCLHIRQPGIHKIYMLYITSLLCMLGTGESHHTLSPRTLLLYNTKINSNICELNMKTSILNVCINMSRLIVVCETRIHIFNLKSLQLLHIINTCNNISGICCLSIDSQQNNYNNANLIIYPSSNDTGELTIYDTNSLHILQTIKAHITPIQYITFNNTNTLLATASTQGTVIRIYSIPSGEKLYTFRRGTTSATINSMSFNSNSTYLALCTNESQTIHIFSMRIDHDPHYNTNNSSNTIASAISSAVSNTLNKSSYTSSIPTTATAITNTITDTANTAYNMLPTVISRNLANATNSVTSIISTQVNTVSQSIILPQLPQHIQDVYEPIRHWTSIQLKPAIHASKLCFSCNQSDVLNIVTTNGLYYSYTIDDDTRLCKLIKEYNLLDSTNDSVSVRFHDLNVNNSSELNTNTAISNTPSSSYQPYIMSSAIRHPCNNNDRYVGIRHDMNDDTSLLPIRINSSNNTNHTMDITNSIHTSTDTITNIATNITVIQPTNTTIQQSSVKFSDFDPITNDSSDDISNDTHALFAPDQTQKSLADSLIALDGFDSLAQHLQPYEHINNNNHNHNNTINSSNNDMSMNNIQTDNPFIALTNSNTSM